MNYRLFMKSIMATHKNTELSKYNPFQDYANMCFIFQIFYEIQ